MNVSICNCFCALWHKTLSVAMAMMLIPSIGKAQTVTVTYNTPGNYTAIVPCGAFNAWGQARGGGGGGGGASVKGHEGAAGVTHYVAAAAAGGGAQGCYTTGTLNAGTIYNITVGSGGSGGVQNGNKLEQEAQPGGFSAVGLNKADGGNGAQSIYTYSKGIGDEGGRTTPGGVSSCSTGAVASGASGSMSDANWNYTAPTNIYGGTGGGSATNGGRCGNSNGMFPGQPGTNAGGGGGGGAARSNDNVTNSASGGAGADGSTIVAFDLLLSITGANTYCMGDELRLSVADPCGSVTYVWRQNGNQIGTGASLVIPGLKIAHSGNYTVEIGLKYPGSSSVTGSNLPAGMILSDNGTLVSAGIAVIVNPIPKNGAIYRLPNNQ